MLILAKFVPVCKEPAGWHLTPVTIGPWQHTTREDLHVSMSYCAAAQPAPPSIHERLRFVEPEALTWYAQEDSNPQPPDP